MNNNIKKNIVLILLAVMLSLALTIGVVYGFFYLVGYSAFIGIPQPIIRGFSDEMT